MSAEPNKNGARRTAKGTEPVRTLPAKTKSLPHNAECEASILGGLILKQELIDLVETLEIDDFYLLQHRVVFEAIRNLINAGTPVDISTLDAAIAKQGKLEAIGGIAFLGELVTRVPTPDNIVAYAKIVRDLSMLRQLADRAAHALSRVYDWEYEPDELLGETLADFEKIARTHREADEKIPVITIDDALDELERLARTPIFETAFPELNKALGFGGLLAGQVYYLAGGTGFGKTSFIATIVRAIAVHQQRRAIIAFYEMFAGYYVARMSASVLNVSANRILRGGVERASIKAALTHRIEMLESPSMKTLQRLVERYVRQGDGAPLIVADYLQLMADKILATMPRPDARLANAQASAGLRELAKSTGAAVVAVTAAGRSASKKLAGDIRKMPARDLIDSSKESGSIEFDGAGIIVLSVSDEMDGEEHIATISVAKARFGQTTHIDARYNGLTGEWREIGRVATVPKFKTTPSDGTLRATIVEVLSKNGILSKSKIADIAKKNKTAVMSEVDAMVGEGLVLATGRGFSLVRDPSEPVPEAAQPSLPEVP